MAVILARSPKEIVERFLAGRASMPEGVQLFVLVTVVVTIAKQVGAMRVLTSSQGNTHRQSSKRWSFLGIDVLHGAESTMLEHAEKMALSEGPKKSSELWDLNRSRHSPDSQLLSTEKVEEDDDSIMSQP